MATTTEQRWDEHVRQWREGGLSARQYAAKTGIAVGTLYGWSARLKRKAGGPQFIEVRPPMAQRSRRLEIRIGEAVAVTVEEGFCPQFLREVVQVLVSL